MKKEDALRPVFALNEYLEKSVVIWNSYGIEPVKDSLAYVELSSFARPISIRTAYSQGDLFIEACADYSMALVKTLTEPLAAIAPWACARGAVESAAFSAWLFDSEINSRQRVKRSLALRYEGLHEQMKFLNAIDKSSESRKSLERIDEIERIATELGFVKVLDHKGKRIGVGQKMPSKTDIVSEVLSKGEDYRILSAMTHSEYWALQRLSFTEIDKEEPASSEGRYFEKHIEPSSISYLCIESLTSLSQAEFMKCKLFGWNLEPLINLYKEVKDKIPNAK